MKDCWKDSARRSSVLRLGTQGVLRFGLVGRESEVATCLFRSGMFGHYAVERCLGVLPRFVLLSPCRLDLGIRTVLLSP